MNVIFRFTSIVTLYLSILFPQNEHPSIHQLQSEHYKKKMISKKNFIEKVNKIKIADKLKKQIKYRSQNIF